jgi:hypothetical protein
MNTIALAVALWLVWRYLATPAPAATANLRSLVTALVPAAALLRLLQEFFRAPRAAQQQALLSLLAGAPEPTPGIFADVLDAEDAAMRDEACPECMTGYEPPPDYSGIGVRGLRAIARARGHRGTLISRGTRQDLLRILA